ncbi:type I-B CRISPR-associated protein Cas5b [Aminobacterium sp. MB27-C1]|uniref:type I-B CRISPR-associated protein Cas5b n=1 Tax=Aminobacterium sp. MB27-C1 TaxID=3070661 RepID=UPI001BD063F6|nr:type I-B CRISPR-associated protein Cas5b [Aminobacterium sp. MB27-C1]WMI71214.1 type I-B CRISPR-associated protein Cas5b [Aminobacterium sp. MB27-C1]
MAVVFEISGRMAMFRKPYTTTSSISYAFPTPTALAGLIAGIAGISHESDRDACLAAYWRKMEGTRVSVSIRNPISWLRQTVNYWNSKNPKKSRHIQVKHQFVANPRYRIYVSGGLEERLRTYLERNAFIYTPCLGVAYALADIDYIGNFDLFPVEAGPVVVDSVVPWSDDISMDVLKSGGAFKELMPYRMDDTRRLIESVSVIYATSPEKKIALRERGNVDVSQCGDDVVAWFPTW